MLVVALLLCCSVALLDCWFAGLLACWFVGLLGCWFVVVSWTLVCWLVSCLIEFSLLVCGVSDPAIPGSVAEWPAGQLDIYPPPSRQGEHGVLDTLAKFLPSSCPRSPKSSLDWPLPCRLSPEGSGRNFSI